MGIKRWLRHGVFLLGVLGTAMSAPAELGDFAAQEELLDSAKSQFGYAVALAGDYAVVGQPDDATQGTHAGAASVYTRRNGHWVRVARLLPSDQGSKGARFGSAVALAGTVVLVGAEGENEGRGAVYIFEQRQGTWTRVRKLTASDTTHKIAFGHAVALSGDYALVGAPDDDDAGKQAGAVYVFQRQQSTWSVRAVQKFFAHDARTSYSFGASLAMTSSTALVGSPGHDNGGNKNDDYGAAYVFELHRGVWLEVATLQAHHAARQAAFGSAVALTAQQALVGAPGYDSNKGAAYRFTHQAGVWTPIEMQKFTASDGTRHAFFGAAVALSDNVLLIGAYGKAVRAHDDDDDDDDHDDRHSAQHDNDDEDDDGHGSKPQAGAVYVFTTHGADWIEAEKVTARQPQSQGHFGYAVALSAQYALVGAPALLGGPSGRAYIYNVPRLNAAPQITSTPITTASVGTLYQYAVKAVDADGDPLLYALTRAPAGMVIHASSGLLAWTPTAAGTVSVEIVVRDGQGGEATQTYTLTVSAPNHPPVITSTPVSSATVGVLYTYQVQASDPDNDPLQYRMLQAPSGMVITQNGLISWTPATVGHVSVQFQVDDGRGGNVTQSYVITVSPANQPPRITSTPNTSATVFQVVPQVTIQDTHLAQHTVTLNGQPYTPGTPITVDGTYILAVEATDTAGNTQRQTIRFTIQRPPAP
jgi:hypothetical protein